MATPATINSWLDALSSSIISTSAATVSPKKRLQDIFRRTVKRHNYARTNQFEVSDRLDGLEEKFQILTLDNLADALRLRRVELQDFQQQWVPDVLHLLLELAGDPARNERLLELYRVPPRIGTPPPLRWKEVLADDPVDRTDRLWRVPDFRDTDNSDYDDEDSQTPSTTHLTASPEITNDKQEIDSLYQRLFFRADEEELAVSLPDPTSYMDQIEEEVMIRHALFMLRGLPTEAFVENGGRISLSPGLHIKGVSDVALHKCAARLAGLRQSYMIVRNCIQAKTESDFIDAMKDQMQRHLRDFITHLNDMQSQLIHPTSSTTASLIRITNRVEEIASPILAISRFLSEHRGVADIALLDRLFEHTQSSQICGDQCAHPVLSSLLVSSLRAYLRPVWHWVFSGLLDLECFPFFIERKAGAVNPSKMWNDEYVIASGNAGRLPNFLAATAETILACGKTSSFLSRLGFVIEQQPGGVEIETILAEIEQPCHLPIVETFQNKWAFAVRSVLELRTGQLKTLLVSSCGLNATLNALPKIYLGLNSALLDEVELKLFDRIDRCMDNWNDRFQVQDMLQDALCTPGSSFVTDAMTVHAIYTSSRRMQSRRSSVKILASLAFDFSLPWPIGNIIDEKAMNAYRRTALILMQIRRAKYSLERVGYMSVMTRPLGDDTTSLDQRYAQILAYRLLNFINTLLNHLMTTTVIPATMELQVQIVEALTVDNMIAVHRAFILRVQHCCLAAPKMKVIRDSLVTILDLCIRFSDLTMRPSAYHGDSDHEASSFISAMSRRKDFDARQYGSDSSDDEYGQLGDGYSSFIVLGDDTNLIQELRNVDGQFRKQLKFLVAGLRGVSRAGTHTNDLGSLADRLAWNQNC